MSGVLVVYGAILFFASKIFSLLCVDALIVPSETPDVKQKRARFLWLQKRGI